MLKKYALIKVIINILDEKKEFTLREISKKLKISPSTAKYSLDFLYKNGIITREVIGKTHLHSLADNFLVRQIKILNSIAEIWNSGLVNEIVNKHDTVMSINIYGSVARGEDDSKSDLDILIIARKPIKIGTVESLKKLKKELNLTILTINEWRNKAANDKVFYDNVIINCINLYGDKPMVI